MNRFAGGRDAKEFLVGKIVEQAHREGVPLSEIERKMLYLSQTDSNPPDMEEVNRKFDQEYNQEDYEKKISGLIGRARNHESNADAEGWSEAIRILSKEDHYILVMTGQVRPPGDLLKLLRTALGVTVILVLGGFVWVYLARRLRVPPDALAWLMCTCLVVVYSISRWLLGSAQMDEITSKCLLFFTRWTKR